ncbi:DUF4982 domain-containing protein [Pelomonas sp. V22]|uniref:glycoside hydrolase family 2 TIM barrel-domain containing protein n=1 Tax=Pelomonas sp. V22 TaxID=2822139 RepID=UPI0024A82ED4|nr:glycoside hydrolase family 2 TIM barrel-domain containing protein [Pelomonas sp. V22]MDI4635476.1 DUF4982 domain-containing protein [Pelomonas sp. V22]
MMTILKPWRIAIATLALLSSLASAAPREVRPLNEGWLFSKSDAGAAMSPGFDDKNWRSVQLPHDWSQEEPFSASYGSGNGYAAGGVGWYRKQFSLAAAQRGRLVSVEFDGIYEHSQVWINGQYVGGRPFGYSSFALNLTPYLRFDAPNVIAVRVDHSRQTDSRYYTGSGIYRLARLVIKDPVHIEQWGTFVRTPQVSAAKAQVQIDTEVVNATPKAQGLTLLSELLDPQGRVVARLESRLQLTAGESRVLPQRLVVNQPQRWSLASPALYSLRQQVKQGGRVLDEASTPFGIRTARFDPDHGFFLNDQSLKLKGVCLHHDAGSLGAAVPESVLERRLLKLRELGVNAIRTSHNPPAPELLALADKLGFLVQAEAFDEFAPTKRKWIAGWNVGEPGRHGYGESFEAWGVRDIEDMAKRDRNHPSIIMWSIGNEVDYANDPFSHPVLGKKYRPENPPASELVRLGKPLVAAFKRMDPSRPVTAAMAHVEMSDAVGFGDILDIAGYNYQELRYAADHAAKPRRVIYGSENRHDYSAWAVVRDTEYISGQFLWTGIDYLGEAGRWPQRGADFGLLDLASFKKPRGWFRESLWSDKPMVYIAAALQSAQLNASQSGQGTPLLDQQRRAKVEEHWNWPAGATLTVSAYSNCDEIQLLLNGRLIGSQPRSAAVEGVFSWTVPYQAGELKAVGLRAGKPVAEFVLKTAGPAARIELAAETAGDGVSHIEYRVVDANGVRVPDADQRITFKLDGALEILGIGNGNLADVDDPRDAVHATYQGRGLAILRGLQGAIEASAPGLSSARIQLSSKP